MLTKFERLSLMNQLKVLKAMDAAPPSVDRQLLILEKGYEHDYGLVFEGIRDPLPGDASAFVYDLLAMFWSLKCFFVKNPTDPSANHSAANFEGFASSQDIQLHN